MTTRRHGAPLLELAAVSMRFVKPLDFAMQIGNLLGAPMSEEVVHAVDNVAQTISQGAVGVLVGEVGCGK